MILVIDAPECVSVLKAALGKVASTLHLSLISLGFLGLYIVAAEVIPDILNARREARTIKADYRVENEDYAQQPWAVAMFLETHRALAKLNWHSYDYWRPAPHGGQFVNVAENGLRRSLPPAQRERTIRVSVFGGSAVWGFGARDEGTIPSLLARQLEQQGACAVEVTNYGQPGFVSGQDLAAFTTQLRQGPAPDIAVFIQGFNDTTSAFAARKAGLPQNEANRAQEFNLTNRNTRLQSFGTVFPLVFWRTNDWLMRAMGKNRAAFPPLPDAERAALAGSIYDVLRSNARMGQAVAREYGVATLHVLQPTLFGKDTRSTYEATAAAQEDVVRPLIQAVQDRAAADWESQPARADLGRLFRQVAAPVFLDGVHLTEAGNLAVAQAVAQRLAPLATAACARK